MLCQPSGLYPVARAPTLTVSALSRLRVRQLLGRKAPLTGSITLGEIVALQERHLRAAQTLGPVDNDSWYSEARVAGVSPIAAAIPNSATSDTTNHQLWRGFEVRTC